MTGNRYLDALVKRVHDALTLRGQGRAIRFGRSPTAPDLLAPLRGAPGREDQRRSFLAVRLGSRELLGFDATWDQAVSRLQRYPLAQVLHVASWISAKLAS